MMRIAGGIVALSASLALVAADVSAQGVEQILRNREELELTEQQVQQLDAIRRETVQERNAAMAEMAELRSQLSAGIIRQSQMMAAREARQDAAAGRVEERRARVEAVLTQAQRDELATLRRRAVRERVQAGPPAQGGPRGPGFAPRGRGQGGPGFAPGRQRPGGRQGPPARGQGGPRGGPRDG